MSVQFIQVSTITCDKCGESKDFVLHDEYPSSLEMELYDDFIKRLKREGWLLTDDEESQYYCPKCSKEVKS